MTMYETSDLLKRMERYETAVDELRAAHQDVRTFLIDQVLYERWLQLGAELGFAVGRQPQSETVAQQAMVQPGMGQQIPQLSETWAS